MILIDYIAIAAVSAAVIRAVILILSEKKRGCSSCGNCPHKGVCDKKADDRGQSSL